MAKKIKEEKEEEEGSGYCETNDVHFLEDGREVREVSREGSLDSSSSSSSSSGTSDSSDTPIPHDHKVDIIVPARTHARIPPISPSPPVVLERPAGYDPNRIPSSIFATRTSNPADWSVASNESLFSIQMGNGSLSRERTAFLFYKSGELTKLDEVFSVPTPLPAVAESTGLQRDSVSSSLAVNSAKFTSIEDDPVNLSNSPAEMDPGNSRNSVILSAQSDGSLTTTSTGSFAFPILSGSGSKSVSVKTSDGERMEPSKDHPPPPPPPPPPQQHHRSMVRSALSNCFSCCTFRWPFLVR